MKRAVSVIILIIALLPLAADPNVPYSMDTVISWSYLTDSEKELMSEIHKGATNHDAEIRLSKGVSKESLTKVLELLYTDYPEILATGRQYGYSINTRTGLISTVRLQYSMDKATEQKLQRALLNAAVEIVMQAPSGEYQKEIYFHDTICDRVTYSSDLDQELIHTAYGALVEGDAVCDGYSKAMTLLCRLAGIRCSVISGMSYNGDTTGFHAWNILQINGIYTLADLTWNDYKQYVRYDYLNVTNKEMDIDHMIVYRHIWPQCDSYDMNWHRLNNLYISKATDSRLKKLVESYAAFTVATDYTISLRFEDYDTFRRFTDNFNDWFAAALKKQGVDLKYWTSVNERQQCFAIRKLSR